MRTLKAFVRVGLLALACATAGAAHASGSFLCEADDKSLKFSAEAMFSHGLAEQFTSFKGALGIRMTEVPQDLAEATLDSTHLAHHWFYGRALKLHIYRERTGNELPGYTELVVETKQNPKDETDFSGTYELTVYHMLTANASEGTTLKSKGKVSCSVG
jgi:hypothetical protein